MKKSEESIENKSKLNKKGVITNIIVILIAIAIMVVMFRTVIQLFMQPTELFVVEKGNLRLEETADAYIIRNEVVLKGENYKKIVTNVSSNNLPILRLHELFGYGVDDLAYVLTKYL